MLSLAAGSQHPELGYEFIRHCASKRMDKLLTLEGGIGCRAQPGRIRKSIKGFPSIAIWKRSTPMPVKFLRDHLAGDQPHH